MLDVVSAHADAAQWAALRVLAAGTEDTLEQCKLYGRLAAVRDTGLAASTLELALNDAVPLSQRSEMVGGVAGHHPDMAFDFAMGHRAVFDALLEPDSRMLYFPGLASASYDPAMLTKLDAFVAAEMAGRTSSRVAMVKATIAHSIAVRQDRLPEVASWLAENVQP